jgi:pyridoxine 4-dehydrogenase
MNENNIGAASETFDVGGEITVNRLGFGAMRITGPGVWGPPDEPCEAVRTLQMLPDLGINFIDTADSYGPDVSEQLIREALHPYERLLIATKGGLRRSGPDQWQPDGRPEYLRSCVEKSLKKLGVEQISLWQLHRIDPSVPRGEQFDAIRSFQSEGLIRYAGLSEVSVSEIEDASRYFRVATVQNRYNLANRASESVLRYCETKNIGFIPWFPLAAGSLMQPGSPLLSMAKQKGVTPSQLALAWLLKASRVMLPIPGTSKRTHLVENTRAAEIILTDTEFQALSNLA